MKEEICKKINDIIDYVLQKELQTGKTLEEAKRKYTHGYCVSLATLIKSQFLDFEDVRMFEFGRTYRKAEPDGRYKWKGQIWHACVVVGGVDDLDRPLPDAVVFDINGGRFFKDMPMYLTQQYPPIDCNYYHDNVLAVNYRDYIIEDNVEQAEMKKYEILREEEGVIEECYYELLKARDCCSSNITPWFVVLSKQTNLKDCGEM